MQNEWRILLSRKMIIANNVAIMSQECHNNVPLSQRSKENVKAQKSKWLSNCNRIIKRYWDVSLKDIEN